MLVTRERRSPVPDFSRELARCDELEMTYEHDPWWESLCDDWADDVSEKLDAWNPRMTRRFLVASVFESSADIYMPDEVSSASSKLIELRQRRNRLELLIVNQRRFGWLSSLLRP